MPDWEPIRRPGDEEFWRTTVPEPIYVSSETFDWLLERLDAPAKPHPRLKRLLRRLEEDE